jgi:hypothetical protein
MATYIGTKYGEPSYSQAILIRYAERVKATRDCINLKLRSLHLKSIAIDAEMVDEPQDCKLMTEKG